MAKTMKAMKVMKAAKQAAAAPVRAMKAEKSSKKYPAFGGASRLRRRVPLMKEIKAMHNSCLIETK